MADWEIRQGDALSELRQMDEGSVQTCVTSPPYWGLRDYGVDGQIGIESTPEEYVDRLVDIFEEVRRVLREDGTLWLNLGDSYSGVGKSGGGRQGDKWEEQGAESDEGKGTWKPFPDGLKVKDLIGIPWRVAFALQEAGWWLRSDIIWAKSISGQTRVGSCMPESVKDRPTSAHEHIFLLSKSEEYFYDHEAIGEPIQDATKRRRTRFELQGSNQDRNDGGGPAIGTGDKRNRRDVWQVNPDAFSDAHFATYPPDLIRPCILAGSSEGDTVLDPFCGSGTTGAVALQHDREFVGIELNEDYIDLAERRIADALQDVGKLGEETARQVDPDHDPGGVLDLFVDD